MDKTADDPPSYKLDTNQDLFICDVCCAEFQTEPEAEKHVDIHRVVIKCPVCPLAFPSHSDLGLHSANHDPEGRIKCPFCPYVTAGSGTYSFKAHLNYVHLKQFPFYCKECGKGFKHSKPYEEHRNWHQGKKPYVCVVCRKGFVYQKYLHVHQVRNHQVGTTGNKIENECRTCNRYFYRPEALKEHVEVCYKKVKKPKKVKAFLCDSCGQTFTEKAKLLEHLRVHRGELPFVCTWCGKRFPVKSYLKTHERVHTGEKPYSCEFCGKRFGQHAPFRDQTTVRKSTRKPKRKYTEYLNVILKESSDDELQEPKPTKLKKEDEVHACKNCNSVFNSRFALQRHKRSQECTNEDLLDEKMFTCKRCLQQFDTLKELKLHRKEHVRKEFIENHTYYFDESQELYICSTCSAEFKDEEEANRHTKSHGEVLQCSQCPAKFQTIFQLGSHLKVTHSADDQFLCPLCPELKFSKPSLFTKHIDTKHQKRYMYNCKECGKGFHSRTLCREHMNVHLGIKPFKCVVCGALFTYSKSVVTHQLKAHRVEILGKSHATECSFCRNRFVSVASLERHVTQVHSTPKPPKEKIHLCDVCGMGFAKKNKMVVHQRVHTGVKPYPCRYCERSFSKSGERNCHERIHTGERPYSCEYCGKAFRQSAPFKVHIRTHTGERPYVCDLCSKGFTTNQGLKLHKKNCSVLDYRI